MIHQPSISGGLRGQATDLKIYADNILRTKKRLTEIYSENTGQPVEKLLADMERDNFMSAEEAKAYGLIDEIVERK
jgi:ATP-dependent Clp protease protease subunit